MNDLAFFDAHHVDLGLLAGIDEAGRGPLFGPVVAACVILPIGCELPDVNDSKKLSAKKRELAYETIIQRAISIGIGRASVQEIESVNIQQATFLAMERAAQACDTPELYLVDGNRMPKLLAPALCVVGGDGKSLAIAAASIIAKVTRDRLMVEMDALYPQYGLARHNGYGTKAHYAALEAFGPCQEHRLSFLKKVVGRSKV